MSAVKRKTAKKPKSAARVKILGRGDPAPFRVINAKAPKTAKFPGAVICDHASNRLPKSLAKTFGVTKAELAKHFSWDIGAEEAAAQIAKKLGMPAVLAGYSRLVVDLNRHPSHPECMTPTSDPFPRGGKYVRIPIPGNADLGAAERKARLNALFWPYQKAIGAELGRFLKAGRLPVLISVHSFTPDMDGTPRPWHIGILWNREEKIAKSLIASFRKNHPQYLVGENQPYSLKDPKFKGSTVWQHAERRGLPYVFVEFRQDLIDTPSKARKWGDMFAEALRPVLEDEANFRKRRSSVKKT